MYKRVRKIFASCLVGAIITTSVVAQVVPVMTVYANESITDELRTEIEASLYDFEYYCMANEDVAVALNYDEDKMYEHWLNFGMAEGRNASMVFNAKYYLEVNPSVKVAVGNDYIAAYEHFVTTGLLAGLESSPVFDVKYYLQTNQDVAEVFGNDYIKAANHFNQNALAEGRSGSGNFDYTVYKDCNTDVAELYGNDKKGYYIHYINHGRAEGRTAGLGTSDDSGNDNTGDSTQIDTNAVSYRIFDASFYLDRYPELKQTVGTDENALYLYWIEEGIDKGQTASPVIVPEEYLELNQDVAQVFGNDKAGALKHFLNNGILEGRTGSYEFDYSIYAYCNTDVGDVFADDIVGYYFHYVKYGKAENRTAATYIPPSEPNVTPTITITPPEVTVTPKPTEAPQITQTPNTPEENPYDLGGMTITLLDKYDWISQWKLDIIEDKYNVVLEFADTSTDDITNEVISSFESGTPIADVIIANIDDIDIYEANDMLYDMTEVFDRDNLFNPNAYLTWCGKKLGISSINSSTVDGLFYNKTWLKELGMEYTPAEMFDMGMWDYESFYEYLKQLKSKMGEDEYPLFVSPYYWTRWATHANGVKVWKDDGDLAYIDEKFLETMKFLQKLVEEGLAAVPNIYAESNGEITYYYNDSYTSKTFDNGNTVLISHKDAWQVNSLTDKFELGYVPYPWGSNVSLDENLVGSKGAYKTLDSNYMSSDSAWQSVVFVKGVEEKADPIAVMTMVTELLDWKSVKIGYEVEEDDIYCDWLEDSDKELYAFNCSRKANEFYSNIPSKVGIASFDKVIYEKKEIRSEFETYYEIDTECMKKAGYVPSIEGNVTLASYFSYSENEEGTIIIDGLSRRGKSKKILTIPEEINGKEVTHIGDKAFYGTNLQEMILPDSIIEIGECAFSGSDLQKIELSNSLVAIGRETFASTDLQEIKLPDSLQSLGSQVFAGTEITELTLPAGFMSIVTFGGGVDDSRDISNVFFKMNKLQAIYVEEGNNTYCSVDGILYTLDKTILVCFPLDYPKGELVIEPETELVGSYALEENQKLEKIVIPEKMYGESFLEYQLNTCDNLSEIEVDENNPYYIQAKNVLISTPPSYDPASGCSLSFIAPKATSITIPKEVTRIITSLAIFPTCLEEIIVENGSESFCSIDGVLFNYDKTTLIKFLSKSSIINYVIPDTVEYIEEDAFWCCDNLETITIGSNVKEIGDTAFANCTKLKELNLPDGLETIEYGAFANCDNLVKLTIPASVTRIGYDIISSDQNTTIYTPAGSYAETYAEEYRITCVTY